MRYPLSKAVPSHLSILHLLHQVSGPLSVSTYMRTALLDPSYGYYTSSTDGKTDGSGRDVLGSRGDFITSPEISQVFGELVAIYFVSRWQAVEMPKKIRLIELGPGRGTLLSDMVRVSPSRAFKFSSSQPRHSLQSPYLSLPTFS